MIHKLKNKKQEQLLNKHLGKEDTQKRFIPLLIRLQMPQTGNNS